VTKQLGLFLLASSLGVSVSAQTPGKVYSTNCENSNALNGSPWSGVTPPYDYYCPVDPNAMISGNSLIVSFGYDATGNNQTWSVSDRQDDAFNLVATSSASNSRKLLVYSAASIAGGESMIDIRLTGGTLNGYWQPTVSEFSNTGTVDASGCNTGNSTAIAASPLTPTQSGDLLYQVSYYPNLTYETEPQASAYLPGNNANIAWAMWYEGLSDGAGGQWGVYNSATAITPTMTAAVSQTYISCAIALKAASTGGPSTDKLIDNERDALPKNGANPWKVAANITGYTVVVTYLDNDPPNPATCCAISSLPSLSWTQTGTAAGGTDGQNYSAIYCAHSSAPIGLITMSIARSGSSNDGIFHIYDLNSTTSCDVDFDSGVLANQTSSGNVIDMCEGKDCLVPTHQNDFIVGNVGEYWGTITGISAPAWMTDDAGYFTGNTVDGYSETDENNGFFFGTNGSSLSAFDLNTTGVYSGANPYPYYWAGRIAAFLPASATPAAPTHLTGTVISN
jgi:hypothetical protein